MNRNQKLAYYLDGFVTIYRPIEGISKNYFGAKTNIRSVENMDMLYKLAYQQSSKRLQDLEFAESSGRDLTIKIKTRLVSGIKNSDKVVIDNILYDIIYTDEDRVNKELYLYLEEVYSIE